MALTDLVIAAVDHQLVDGVRKTVQGSNPAANAEVSETVPAGKAWALHAVTVSLVQGITQTPAPTLIIDDGTNVLFQSASLTAQTASTTSQYTWAQGVATGNPVAGGAATAALPSAASGSRSSAGLILGPGYRVRTSTGGIGANTDYGAPVFYITEYQIS